MEERRKMEIDRKLAQYDRQNRELQQMQQEINEANDVKHHVQGMIDNGQITQDANGQFRAVQDPAEQEHLRQQAANASKQKFSNAPRKEQPHMDISDIKKMVEAQEEDDLE